MLKLSKFDTFINILDCIRKEAPLEFKKYHILPDDIEKLNQARSRAFIHLFLKVKYGILEPESVMHLRVNIDSGSRRLFLTLATPVFPRVGLLNRPVSPVL